MEETKTAPKKVKASSATITMTPTFALRMMGVCVAESLAPAVSAITEKLDMKDVIASDDIEALVNAMETALPLAKIALEKQSVQAKVEVE